MKVLVTSSLTLENNTRFRRPLYGTQASQPAFKSQAGGDANAWNSKRGGLDASDAAKSIATFWHETTWT
jgi:hypothetical protein